MPPSNIRNERDDITTDPADAQRPIAEYYEQLHANKFTSLRELDRYLGSDEVTKLP